MICLLSEVCVSRIVGSRCTFCRSSTQIPKFICQIDQLSSRKTKPRMFFCWSVKTSETSYEQIFLMWRFSQSDTRQCKFILGSPTISAIKRRLESNISFTNHTFCLMLKLKGVQNVVRLWCFLVHSWKLYSIGNLGQRIEFSYN